jgi:transposase
MKTIIDATKLSPDEQWFLRKTIVKFHLKGKTPNEIAGLLDTHLRSVHRTIKKFRDGGWEAISLKKMGRPVGSYKTLTPDQESKVKEVLIARTPEQYEINSFLWDMRSVLILITMLFCIKVPRSTMSEYFSLFCFTPQRPIIRNYKQNPEHVKHWLEVEYPEIKARAKEENAEIYWGDETGIQNTCNYVRGYAPQGKTPVAKVSTQKKLRINMISAINNQGKLRFMTYEGKMNQKRLIEFMSRLIKSSDKKVYLILDNLNVHHGKIVKAWVEERKHLIEIFFIPSYSPDLNPDEYFNGTLKREMESRGNVTTKEDFFNKVRSAARKIQRDR